MKKIKEDKNLRSADSCCPNIFYFCTKSGDTKFFLMVRWKLSTTYLNTVNLYYYVIIPKFYYLYTNFMKENKFFTKQFIKENPINHFISF